MRIRNVYLCAAAVAMGLLASGCGAKTAGTEAAGVTAEAGAESGEIETVAAEAGAGEAGAREAGAAAADETASQIEVGQEGMEPVYGRALKDGIYPIRVDSSSSMFRITECELTVKDGAMSAVMTMGGTGYLKLYMGTAEEALEAPEEDCIPYVEQADGTHTYEVPVEALDMGIDCSAFSKNKEKWYDRVLVFRSDSLPATAFAEGTVTTVESLGLEDGTYTIGVTLEGGSGRASVESPAALRVEAGKAYATIIWSSSNYDYMKVDGEKFDVMDPGSNSTFEIPVSGFDWRMPVIADTIAMSEPHEVDYILKFDSATLEKTEQPGIITWDAWDGRQPDRSLELFYANQFSVDYYDGGYAMITMKDSGRYLVVPEGADTPQGLPEDVAVIRQPLTNIYLVATSAMDLFCSLDGLDAITLSGTDADHWYLKEAKQAMEEGRMDYAGKYNAPDYELILSKPCDLAIESTMIHHSPEVKEQLEKLGIPVLVERSSYENHPLGRMEWLKLYGVLLGKEELAEACFEQQRRNLEPVINQQPTGKTVAFFYISSNGYVNVRKSGDYVAKMIELAGGAYVPQNLTEHENALSTMNMQMEAFYAAAKDADYIIYNSTIDGELKSLDELLKKSSLLADFKAVKEGNVWCTEKNLFQETMGLGDMILDIHKILTEDTAGVDGMTYMHRLR